MALDDELDADVIGYQRAQAPTILDSGGYGPCIVVGALYGKKGFLSHDTPNTTCPYLRELLEDLKKEARTKKYLKVYIGGGFLIPEDYSPESIKKNKEDTARERKYVLNLIAEYGFEKCIKEIRWLERGDQTSALELRLAEGKAVFIEDEVNSEQ